METAQMDFSYFSAPTPYQFMYADENIAADSLDAQFSNMSYDTFSPFPATMMGPASPTTAHSPMIIGSVDSGLGGEGMEGMMMENAQGSGIARTTRSSSEEKETNLTPAQTRRKAQNRAAQRAFRERKERHVRDLEQRLAAAESSATSLQSDNERLRLALQRAKTENEILRATSSHVPPPGSDSSADSPGSQTDASIPDPVLPSQKSARNSLHSTRHKEPSYSTSLAHATKNPLSAGGAWDLIQSHPLVKAGLVDIGDVCERLKGLARCDGMGLVFEEREVWRAVEGCRRGGGDELI